MKKRSRFYWVFVAWTLGSGFGWSLSSAAYGQEAGASTFKSARKTYAPKKRRPEEIAVPAVTLLESAQVKPEAESGADGEAAAEEGDSFGISRFEVLGDTLLGLAEVERTLMPFTGEGASFARVQQARTALQEAYASAGFLTINVGIPPQQVTDGVVKLVVSELRLGEVAIENEGRRWLNDARVRSLLPQLHAGILLRESELQEGVSKVNAQPDVSVSPVLIAGRVPGTVDLKLVVDDRAPLHGGFGLNNQHSAGSPGLRSVARLSYADLWERRHALSLTYGFVPTASFADSLVLAAAYAMPVPRRPDDRVIFSYADSSSDTVVPDVPGLSNAGDSVSIGARYDLALPSWHDEAAGMDVVQGLSLGLDLRNVKSTLTLRALSQRSPLDDFDDDDGSDLADDPGDEDPGAEPASPRRVQKSSSSSPIRYRPLSLEYWALRTGRHSRSAGSLTLRFHRTGWLGTANADTFRFVRGSGGSDSAVTGDYEVLGWDFEHVLRASSLLRSLALGRWLWDARTSEAPLDDDWNLVLRGFGQLASEPLIPTEQLPGGGPRTVRGYLEAEASGDAAWGMQLELVSRAFPLELAGQRLGNARWLLFYDDMRFLNLEAAEGQPGRQRLYSLGAGLRVQWRRGLSGEFLLGYPLQNTERTPRNRPRLDFRLDYGF